MSDKNKHTYGNPEKLMVGQMPDYAKNADGLPKIYDSAEKEGADIIQTLKEVASIDTQANIQKEIQELIDMHGIECLVIIYKPFIVSLRNTLKWMIADIDFRNQHLVEREIGLEKSEDSDELKIARKLLKEIEGAL